ncbi:hypothetical protein D3C71_1123670 [compost metagenome]
MPVLDVPDLVGQHARQDVRGLRQLDQFIGDDDLAARQGQRVGADKDAAFAERQPEAARGSIRVCRQVVEHGLDCLLRGRRQRGGTKHHAVQGVHDACANVSLDGVRDKCGRCVAQPGNDPAQAGEEDQHGRRGQCKPVSPDMFQTVQATGAAAALAAVQAVDLIIVGGFEDAAVRQRRAAGRRAYAA